MPQFFFRANSLARKTVAHKLTALVLEIISKLLELDKALLKKALTERKMEVKGSVTVIPLKVDQVKE